MRIISGVTLSIASLVLSAVAAAAEPSIGPHLPWDQQAARAVTTPGHYAAVHWTAVIGTGSGASAEHQLVSLPSLPSAASQPRALQNWSALIGTGTAAALERGPTG